MKYKSQAVCFESARNQNTYGTATILLFQESKTPRPVRKLRIVRHIRYNNASLGGIRVKCAPADTYRYTMTFKF